MNPSLTLSPDDDLVREATAHLIPSCRDSRSICDASLSLVETTLQERDISFIHSDVSMCLRSVIFASVLIIVKFETLAFHTFTDFMDILSPLLCGVDRRMLRDSEAIVLDACRWRIPRV